MIPDFILSQFPLTFLCLCGVLLTVAPGVVLLASMFDASDRKGPRRDR